VISALFISDELAIRRQIHGYHQNFLNSFLQYFDPRGKKILEVGGNFNPTVVMEDIGVAQWTAVQDPSFPYNQPTPNGESGTNSRGEFHIGNGYTLVLKDFDQFAQEEIQPSFDAAFSMACFEHVSTLPRMLSNIKRLLKPGGMLYTIFAPIWSGPNGHHFNETLIPNSLRLGHEQVQLLLNPWEHLYLDRTSLVKRHESVYGYDLASEIAHVVYNHPHVNRWHFEDYNHAVSKLSFQWYRLRGLFEADPPEEITSTLDKRYGQSVYKNFRSSGIELIAIR